MTRFRFLLIILLSASSQLVVAQAAADKILGHYLSPKKDGKIEVYKVGEMYFGKVVSGNNPRKDVNNPNPALRTRDLLGMVFLTNFVYKNNEYSDGEIYDPENGKTYSCKMWLDKGNLKVRGYIGLSIIGRTETFTKVN
ncbi:DUF2147 domain-containing protein [Fibrella sp. HMF5335]|uniref:DUF2147 domain-containing protein n=1 Tax=Fibrella rubiginis TaxID=2817060 RepID=A0A939K5M4_9BACT|nr:DUF2147 domain-containing protein [Fibrella rubiginis]MBO0936625.1 DUF2147 domain-containing protein [Fibrella rubiginis]